MHTAQTHEEASQTSKWSLLQKRLIIAKSSILGADYMAENRVWTTRDEIFISCKKSYDRLRTWIQVRKTNWLMSQQN